MECHRDDLVSLNQQLFMGLNPRNRKDSKRKTGYNTKSGWKIYDGDTDNVKNHLIAENMLRKGKKKRLDFTNKAVNPAVYPNFDPSEVSGLMSRRNEIISKESGISKNIERDNVLDDGRQIEREESLDPMLERGRANSGTSLFAGRQKYFITQVRNYLPLVKNSDIRGKLKLFLKYLHNTPSAKELTINDKGHVQRGLFDTQTKFSDYLNYYVLSSEEKLHVKKPPFYNVILGEPLAEYLTSSKQGTAPDNGLANVAETKDVKSLDFSSRGKANTDATKTEDREEDEQEYNDEDSKGVIPLRNIKDSDLRLESSLPKMINLLTSLNIDMTGEIDENDYEKLIDIAAFPIYATNPSKSAIYSKEEEYNEFGDMLRTLLTNGKEGTNKTVS